MPGIKKGSTGIKKQPKRWVPDVLHKWQFIYTHPVHSAPASRALSTDLIASISSGVNCEELKSSEGFLEPLSIL